jgi:sarcosine oxidase subunit alpha
MTEGRPPVARTPLHPWHAAHGARFQDRDGWQVVADYGDPRREAAAARADLGLADVSSFAKISLRGPAVPALVRALVPDSPVLGPRGVAVIPGLAALACRLTADSLLLLDAAPAGAALRQRLAGLGQQAPAVQTDVTSAYAGFLVLGPPSDEFLRRLTHLDVRPAALPENSCAETALAGVEGLLVRRGGLPVPALQVHVAWDLGEYVWERLLEAGRDWQITPVGLEALALLRAAG